MRVIPVQAELPNTKVDASVFDEATSLQQVSALLNTGKPYIFFSFQDGEVSLIFGKAGLPEAHEAIAGLVSILRDNQ